MNGKANNDTKISLSGFTIGNPKYLGGLGSLGGSKSPPHGFDG